MALTRLQLKAMFAKKFKEFNPNAMFQVIPKDEKDQLQYYKERKEYHLALAKNEPPADRIGSNKLVFGRRALNDQAHIKSLKRRL